MVAARGRGKVVEAKGVVMVEVGIDDGGGGEGGTMVIELVEMQKGGWRLGGGFSFKIS